MSRPLTFALGTLTGALLAVCGFLAWLRWATEDDRPDRGWVA